MVIILKMTVGKVLWLVGLFTATAFAYNSTCTDLSWGSKVKREKITLHNSGNHILVLTSMRLGCFGDDRKFEYTNKSVLLNPGQSIDLPSDPWMSYCSVTFCSACLIHQCNIITHLNPNATLTFLYNDSNNLVDFSGVGHTHRSHVRTKKYGHQVVAATAVCPNDMVTVWEKKGIPTALIDIPNRKKKKTVYTVKVTCNGSYLSDDHGKAIDSFTHTTPVMKSRADVTVSVPLQELEETPRTCTLNACLNRRRSCKQKVLCTFTIPNNSVTLEKITKFIKRRYKTVGCSQTKWAWSVVDQETGNLHLRLRNKDWKEKSFKVSVHCKRLRTLNGSLLVTVPPMVYTKLVTFPLEVLAMKRSFTSIKCVIKLCNTAKRKCGRNTKCSIKLPVKNGKFITTTLFNITDNNNNNGQCGSKAVSWSPQGTQRGKLSVQLQNSKQESVNNTVSVNCSGLDVLKEEWKLTVELPPNSQQYTVVFNLKPSSIYDVAGQTYCAVNTCNVKNCKNMGESCNITIPVKDGLFPEIEDGNTLNMNNKTDNNSIDSCESKSVIWTPQGTQRGLLSVQLVNSRQVSVITQVSVNCSELETLNNEKNLTVDVPTKSLHVVEFKLKPKDLINVTAMETYCSVTTCNRENCGNQEQLCSFDITIPIKDGTFPMIEEGNNTGNLTKSVTWSQQGTQRGIVLVQLQNSKQKAVKVVVSVNCAGLEVANGKRKLTINVPANSQHVTEFKLKPASSIDVSAVETYCIVNICNKEDCKYLRESKNITIPIEDGLFPDDGILTNEIIWSQQGKQRGALLVQLQNTKQKSRTADISVNCSGLMVVNGEWNLTINVHSNSLKVAEFMLKPSSLDVAAAETFCTTKICTSQDCNNERVSRIRIPVKNGFFPDRNESTNSTGKFDVDSVTWTRRGTQRGIVSVQLRNFKQETVNAEVSVKCSGLEVLKKQWNLTVEVPANSTHVVEFKLKPSSLDNATVETYCMVKICNRDDCENQRESHNITIPVKKGLFPKNDNGVITNNNDTSECDPNSVTWAPEKLRRGTVSVQLLNSKQEAVITQVSVVCSELVVLKNKKWNLTVEVPANSLQVTEFKLKPKKSINATARETYCTVAICREDCWNHGRLCNIYITIPVRNGAFPKDGREATTSDGSFVEDGREAATSEGSFLEDGREAATSEGSFLEDGREAATSEGSFLEDGREVATSDGSFLEDRREAASSDGLFPEDGREATSLGQSDENGINKRETTALCPSYVIFSNQSSSDLSTVFVIVQNIRKKALPFNIEIICNNINVFQDNGTLSESITKRIPSIQTKTQKVVEFRFQNNSNRDKACALDICVQRKTRCVSEISCGFTFINEIAMPPDHDSSTISEGCSNHLKWRWSVLNQNEGIFDVILPENVLDGNILFNVTLHCDNLNVLNDSIAVILRPWTNKTVSFTVAPSSSVSKFATTTRCGITLCGYDCRNSLVCDVDIPVYKRHFVMSKETPTTTPMPMPTTIPMPMPTMTTVLTTDTPTMTNMPTEEEHIDYKECTQKDVAWEVNQPHRGIMRVRAYNNDTEEIEATITVQCSSFLQPVKDRITDTIIVPGKSFRPTKFRFLAESNSSVDAEEARCVVNVCLKHNCMVGMKETCILRIPMKNGSFVPVKPAKKKDNQTKYISHGCHEHHTNEIHSPAPCHDKMWNLVYTSAQLEGEALLAIALNLKPNNQVDLRTNVSLECEGIIIEDDAQKTLILSKYERQRNISFAFAAIRSLHLERHICTLSIKHSLLIASTDNFTDDAIEKLCVKGEKCSIAIDSRLGRIIPKCKFHQVKSLIKVDQKSAMVTIDILPSVYDVFTYEAHCSKNNPFIYDPLNEKKKNTFISESKETKVVTVDFAPDCTNDTIRKEYENYRKDDCNFLLYGYCQGGELLLEKLVNIPFDQDKMFCTPKLLFNKWLQSIQKHTGIHNKPLAAVLAVLIVIVILLIVIIFPIIIVVYFCCCRHHRDDAKRPSVGIVISSGDEWEETNAMLNAMSIENSKFLIGRSDQKFSDKKFPITEYYGAHYDSFDSISDYGGPRTPIYDLDSGDVNQNDRIDQADSAIYHDCEDYHHYHKHIDQHDPGNQQNSTATYLELKAAIKQLETINESLPEEQYSKLSVTRTDLSSPLNGWGDEDEDSGELLQSTNY